MALIHSQLECPGCKRTINFSYFGQVVSEYQSLHAILQEALIQASEGKGKERHASEGEAFENQPICEIARRLDGGPLYQAVKKIYESVRLPGEPGVRELLGAINYIAAEIILRREHPGPVSNHP